MVKTSCLGCTSSHALHQRAPLHEEASSAFQGLAVPWLQVTKSAKQQQQRKAKAEPAFEDQAAASDAPRKWHDYNVHFEFPSAATAASSGNLITLNDVGFKYPNRDDFGLSSLDIGIDMGSRIAIVGPNGAGKSTLMNLLAGGQLAG